MFQTKNIKGFSTDSVSEGEKPHTLSIYNNISNTNNISILANKGTTWTKPECISKNVVYLKCDDCAETYALKVGCDSKTCEACQIKRRQRLFKKYQALISQWENGKNDNIIQFLMLTHKNVDNLDIYQKSVKDKRTKGGYEQIIKYASNYIEKCDKQLSAFQKRLKRKGLIADYGFINKEMTWTKDKGYHYHNHLLIYGKKLDKVELQQIWKQVTKDSHVVGLEQVTNFNDKEHSLRYMLKYVAKTQQTNEGMQQYYNCTKGARTFNTFGKRYGKLTPQKQPIVCQECGGSLKVLFSAQPKNAQEIDYKKVRRALRLKALKQKINIPHEVKSRENADYLFSASSANIDKLEYNQLYEYYELVGKGFSEKDIEYYLKIGELYEPKPARYSRL